MQTTTDYVGGAKKALAMGMTKKLLLLYNKNAVWQLHKTIKGKSSLIIHERHANLKYKHGNRSFWCRGYFVDTVGKNAKKIEEYIKNQLEEDKLQDQLTIREFEYFLTITFLPTKYSGTEYFTQSTLIKLLLSTLHSHIIANSSGGFVLSSCCISSIIWQFSFILSKRPFAKALASSRLRNLQLAANISFRKTSTLFSTEPFSLPSSLIFVVFCD